MQKKFSVIDMFGKKIVYVVSNISLDGNADVKSFRAGKLLHEYRYENDKLFYKEETGRLIHIAKDSFTRDVYKKIEQAIIEAQGFDSHPGHLRKHAHFFKKKY